MAEVGRVLWRPSRLTPAQSRVTQRRLLRAVAIRFSMSPRLEAP